ncbi:phosphohydrolase [Flavonifractor plautii]|nr:phosphohydrolase [Flavonifractor plautii]
MNQRAWMEYRACVEELLFSSQVQHMKSIRHHPGVSCYEHSVFVSYVAWYLADRWGPTRAPLRGRGCSTTCISTTPHPALLPAVLCPSGRRRGECGRAVRRPDRPGEKLHFGPHVAPVPPGARSREAAAVCLADKLCATAEIMQIWRNLGLRRAVLSGA